MERKPSRGPLARNRQERLLSLLRSSGNLLVSQTAAEFGVSEMTIRRDLEALAGQGLLVRVHGGATLPERASAFETQPGSASSPRPEGTRFTIGMVVPTLDYYWSSIIAGARAAAADAQVRLLLRASTFDFQSCVRQIKIFAETPGIDGLIVTPDVYSPQAPAILHWLDGLPIPVVLAERQPQVRMRLRRLEWVASDHALGAAMAVQHLYAQGHRRIGLLAAHGNHTTTPYLYQGWRDELQACHLAPDAQLVSNTEGFGDLGRGKLMDDVLARCRRTGTTAVIVQCDPYAISFVQHCMDNGIRVPEDLAVVAYDDEVAELGQPALTAICPPKAHIGRLAVELLAVRLMEGTRRPPHRTTISPVLNIRDSSVFPVPQSRTTGQSGL